jgi:hypothetical protein
VLDVTHPTTQCDGPPSQPKIGGFFNWGEFDGWLDFLIKKKWILEGEGIYCGWIVAFP